MGLPFLLPVMPQELILPFAVEPPVVAHPSTLLLAAVAPGMLPTAPYSELGGCRWAVEEVEQQAAVRGVVVLDHVYHLARLAL